MVTDNNSSATNYDDNYIDSEDELEMTVTARASHLIKKGLYYVTDIEKFQPPRKRPKYVICCALMQCLKGNYSVVNNYLQQ
jgi:hypothetical protein